MGAWGYKNFERDDAYDELGLLLEHITSNISAGFQYEHQKTLFDGRGDSAIVANVDIICTLCEHYGTYPDIELDKAISWKKEYLDIYDTVFAPKAQSQQYVKERREAVIETFNRLIKLLLELDED